MTTTITLQSPSDDETPTSTDHRQVLHPPPSDAPAATTTTTTVKPFPQSILRSIEVDRRHRLPHSRSTSDFRNINQSSIDTTDEDFYDHYESITTTTTTTNSSQKRSFIVNQTRRSPSELRLVLCPDVSNQQLINHDIELSSSTYENETHHSNPSLLNSKSSKQSRTEYLRRNILERRFGRRIHSTLSSSSSTLRSLGRRFPLQNLSSRVNHTQPHCLSRHSKWHFVRTHLTDIAMMNDSYARRRIIERDIRWIHLRELIRQQVLEMREMSILRQQFDGILKKSPKTSLALKAIPAHEVVHIERDGHVYSMGTRDLVLGRLINDENHTQLDAFAQLDARRRFQIKQNLLRQQEGRTRLKRHIAFSFCLCNLSFIALMCAAMFLFAMKTIIELRSKEFI